MAGYAGITGRISSELVAGFDPEYLIIYDLLSKVWILCKFSDLTITQNIIGYTATVATVFGATTKRTTTKYDTSVKS